MEHTLINWIEIPVENLDRAIKFYRKTFSVDFLLKTFNDIPHAIFKENAQGKKPMNGALMEVKNKSKGDFGAVLYFEATGRFELMVESIEENGGKILIPKSLIRNKLDDNTGTIPETFIDNKTGYFLHFLDSEGNKMGLYGSN